MVPERHERIAVPTTVLWPELDPLFPPAWGDRLDEFFAEVTLTSLPGVGHFVPIEAPDEFAAAIRAALAASARTGVASGAQCRDPPSFADLAALATYPPRWDLTSRCAITRGRSATVLIILARRTLDIAIAADLAAETFALAFGGWPKLQGRSDEEIRAWLFTVARRQVGRYLRTARAEQRAVRRLGIQVPVVHEDDIDLIEERAGLSACVAS